jgi:hypothetical protein
LFFQPSLLRNHVRDLQFNEQRKAAEPKRIAELKWKKVFPSTDKNNKNKEAFSIRYKKLCGVFLCFISFRISQCVFEL